MKVAAAQISCSLGDPKANLLKVREFSRRGSDAGVELIVFPEMTDTGYSMSVIEANANSWTSGFVPGLQEIAAKLSIAIVCGVSERDGTSIYNSLVFVDQQGQIAAKYRKAILDAGGSKPAGELVRDFLGREPDFEAYQNWLNTTA